MYMCVNKNRSDNRSGTRAYGPGFREKCGAYGMLLEWAKFFHMVCWAGSSAQRLRARAAKHPGQFQEEKSPGENPGNRKQIRLKAMSREIRP